MFNLIAGTTAAVKQAAGMEPSSPGSQGAERSNGTGENQRPQTGQEEQQEEGTTQGIGQDIQQAVPPKKPKKVTIAKASTRKIATRSSSKAPEGGEGGAETGKGRSEEEQAGGEDIGRELWEVAKGGTEKEAQGSGTDDPVDIRRDSPRTSRAEHGKHDLQGAMLDMIRWRKGRRRKARQVKPSYSIRYALGWEEQSSKDIPPTQSTPSPTTPGSPISTSPPSSTIPPPSPLHVHIRLSEKQLCPCRSQASRFQPRARATFRG